MTERAAKKSIPHYRMTCDDAIAAYQTGLITAKGLVYYVVKSSRQDGHKFRIKNVVEFCKRIGISRGAYYKAIAKLKDEGVMGFDVIGEMDLWVEPISSRVVTLHSDVSPNEDTESTNGDSQYPNGDTDSPNEDSQSTNGDSKGLEPLSNVEFANSSILSQSFFNPLSVTPPTRPQTEEGEKKSELKEIKNKPSAPNINSVSTQVKSGLVQQSVVTGEDKSFAEPVTTKPTDPFYQTRRVQDFGKVPFESDGVFSSKEEQDDFYGQLMEYARNRGISYASGWAIKVLRGVKSGEPCPFLNEYRQGIPVGTCDQQEWESRPGVPHEKFITFLTARFHRTGWTKEQAIAEAHRRIRDTKEAADLWQACLQTITNLSSGWEKQKALGVSAPYIPPELQTRDRISVEEAGKAIAALEGVTPSLSPSTPAPALPEGFEGDPNTYREYKPFVQVSKEEARANILRLKEMMQNRGGTIKALPAPEQPKPETILQQLVADLADPIMRRDATVQALAQRFVGENEEYAADYDEAGMIVAIYQF